MSRLGPIILIVVGAVLLASSLGIMPIRSIRAWLTDWWPLLLILIGAYLLFERSGRK